MKYQSASMLNRIVVGALCCHIGYICAQTGSVERNVEQSIQRMQRYQDEASALSSEKIFQEMERIRTILEIKSKNSPYSDFTDEDTLKASGYAAALQAKRKDRSPAAAYYWGVHNSRICSVFDANPAIGNTSKTCWTETLESFQLASESGIARASLNIGLMYENGWGVAKSKFIAADWFMRGAEKFKQDGSREGALESLEAAIRVVPDLPAAVRLKEQLFK